MKINKKPKSIGRFIALALTLIALIPILSMLFRSITVSNQLITERNQMAQVSASTTILEVKESIYDAAAGKLDELIHLPMLTEEFYLKEIEKSIRLAMVGDPNVSEIVFSTENGQFATVGEVPVDYAPTTRPWFKLAMEKKAK